MYLRDLIIWRLHLADQEENEWNQDKPFFWRTLMHRREVSVEGMEAIAQMYENEEYDKVEALAGLFVECWDNYAEGRNYLGLTAMTKNDLAAAQTHFKNAMAVGRTLFPKRIRKDRYWSDVSTRPCIRSIIYLAQTCNRNNEYTRALALCDQLDKVTDHNTGVELMRSLEVYLHNKKHTGKKMLTLLLENFKALVKDVVDVRQCWRNGRSDDRKWFDRLHEMESIVFAEETADSIWPQVEVLKTAVGKQMVP